MTHPSLLLATALLVLMAGVLTGAWMDSRRAWTPRRTRVRLRRPR